ncbi:MAG: hypothetical protein ACRBCI_12345 [Cellvibrionaceae bacterium]
MKTALQKLFSPILTGLDSGRDPFVYKPSHRTILIAVGCLFSLLTIGVLFVGLKGDGYGFVLPSLVFGGAGFISLLVGSLGSDRAVAKIWGSR